MARLEELTVGRTLLGVVGQRPVTIVAVKWFGTAGIELTYKTDDGRVHNQLLYRHNEPELEVVDDKLGWSFSAEGSFFQLAAEAHRIRLAHLFDPYLAVHISAIEPLPHQISAVYQEMLPRLPLRYILADDPGAGKTIMTGLLLKELMIRGDVKRCLIVAPGNLAEQWKDELYSKFGLRFEILSNDRLESSFTGNAFAEINLCIARLDTLARNEAVQEKLSATDWDLIVCDEAHKMSATVWGNEVKYTRRFQLGRRLSNLTRHFLLLTATPHNGKPEDFQLFMSLIDQDRFEGLLRSSHQSIDVSDVMRRMVKEDLLKFDGRPLFPERIAHTINYDLSDEEAHLYTEVTTYVEEEFNRADKLNNERKTTVGFALTILQRRLASSPEAIYQSLKRRRERLENRLAEEKIGKRAAEYGMAPHMSDDPDEIDDLPSSELEAVEEQIVDLATAAATIQELEAEISTLRRLERMANEVRMSGNDRKWEELSALLQDNENMFDAESQRQKLIIFTEHRDTLNYLASQIRSLLGNDEAVVTIHGGLVRDERRKVESLFKQDKDVRVLVATDAAGEGINLQRAHLMVNYDLPWNPNRLEQRFGRIHRIGQTEVCHLWNLVSKETREGAVFLRLLQKLEEERSALGGKVFDVLGQLTFDNKPLRELLIEAIRYGNLPEVRDRLNRVIDSSLDRASLQELLKDHLLLEDSMDVTKIMSIREDMERMEARRLQPHFIQAFFKEAFQHLGGTAHKREQGRYELTRVPAVVRSRDRQIGFAEPVLNRYEKICFDKEDIHVPGKPEAELICPGHPLLTAVLDVICEQLGETLRHGTILIDDQDYGDEARVLFLIEDTIQDGKLLPDGRRRTISRRLHFVEMNEEGSASDAGFAPYLDYSPVSSDEKEPVRAWLDRQAWLSGDLEEKAAGYAISELIPTHYSQVSRHRVAMAAKTEAAVRERLQSEIRYWDMRAAELKEREAAGKVNANLNSTLAARRAEDLSERLCERLAELAAEKSIAALPPTVVGGAIIIPRGLLSRLCGKVTEIDHTARREVELAAMHSVMEIERQLGHSPIDVSSQRVGYDIESRVPPSAEGSGHTLRFIEVKGRTSGANTVTVTRNEVVVARNQPEQYILALVEMDTDTTRTTYLKKPFFTDPDKTMGSINYIIEELMSNAEIIHRSEATR